MNLLDALAKLMGGAVGASASTSLGSGYDRAADEAAAAARLEQLQNEAIAMFPADQLPGGKIVTKCNYGLIHIAQGLNCRDLDGMNATSIVQHIGNLCVTKPDVWREDSWERAVEHAKRGGLAFLGMEAPRGEAHGHVASVAPRDMEMSGSWGALVPYLANVGKPPNAFLRASQCFRAADRPMLRCFLWGA